MTDSRTAPARVRPGVAGRYVEARRTWACQCRCGCVHLIPATDKYWLDSGTNQRLCVVCSQQSSCRVLRIVWPDHGLSPCCSTYCVDAAGTDYECGVNAPCCDHCAFRGGGCVVECVCGTPICTTSLAPHGFVRWDDRDVHGDCYQVAVEHGLMTPGGDE